MNFFKQRLIYFILFFTFLFYLQGIFNLPVMDRDEARFATASKTMMESKNFIDIRMHDEIRYKKPVGIYWLHSISNFLFGKAPYDKIWVYRLPSAIGIILALLLIYNYTRKLYGDKQSLLSVFFLVSSLLTISEIHQAKTDGVLFLTVVVCNLLILKGINKSFLAFKEKIIFWLFLSTGILIKGPIIIIFTLLPLTIISILRKENLVNIIWSKAGLLVFALVCIPWYVAITIVSDGLFWHESLINDLFNKVKSGQESHGFPPGYYLLLLSIMFWPGVIFLPILIKKISQDWKLKFLEKKEELFIFLWLIIPFVIYEIIPTKLPHYIFPSYAALSILISNLVKKKYLTGKTYKFICFLMLFFPFLFLGSKIFVLNEYSTIDYTLLVIIPFFLVLILFQIFWFLKKNILGLIISTFIFQSLVYLSAVYYLIPRLDKLWVSEKINTVISQNYYQVDKVLHFGFNEPSLIFLTSHKSKKKNLKEYKNEILSQKILYIVSDEYSDFVNDETFSDFKLIDEFNGFNYSQGKNIVIKFFLNQ